MNQRIKELADEAREFATTRHPVSNIVLSVNSEKFEEKFAELIVEDNLRILRSNGYDDAAQCLQDVHFGIDDPV